jgi:16S rRNA (uracil1498-N3)-methyltransferase
MSERAPPRLFVEAPLRLGAAVTLGDEQSHYLLNVMRRGSGDAVLLFNGRDGEWRAAIGETRKRACVLHVEAQLRAQTGLADLWLLFAPIKRQRIDLIAEKATELGVGLLQPVITERTVVPHVNLDRLRAHAIEAAEQCGLLSVPALRAPIRLTNLLERWPEERCLIFCDEGGSARPALEALSDQSPGPCALLVGPEGGFSDHERLQLVSHKAVVAVSLGPRLLRADTAAVAALALWQSVQGDWRHPSKM